GNGAPVFPYSMFRIDRIVGIPDTPPRSLLDFRWTPRSSEMTTRRNLTKRSVEGRGRKAGQTPTDVENPAGRRDEEVSYDAGDLGRRPDVTDTTTARFPRAQVS